MNHGDLTFEDLQEVIKGQITKWLARKQSAAEDEEIALVDHYQLMLDQAHMLYILSKRVRML